MSNVFLMSGKKESAIAEPPTRAIEESAIMIFILFGSITLTPPFLVVMCGFQCGISSKTKWDNSAIGIASTGFAAFAAITAATIVCGVSSTSNILKKTKPTVKPMLCYYSS